MTSRKLGIFVDDASITNVQTQLHLLGEELPDDISLDLFYHEEFPDCLNKNFHSHKVQLNKVPLLEKNSVVNILSRIYSFTKAGRKYIRDSEPDAIIGFVNPPVMGTAAGLAAYGTSTKAIYRYSGDSFQEYKFASKFSKMLAFSHYNVIGRAGLYACDEFIVLGPNGHNALSQRGIENEQIHLIPPLIDQDVFYPDKSSIDIRSENTIGLFVGRLNKRKGADLLKQIITESINRRENVEFIILGEGPMAGELESISSDRVHVKGYVPHSEIVEYYRTADFLIHPSRIEGLPNVLLEAHACGLPTVTSSVGEMPYYSDYIAEHTSEYVDIIEHIIDTKIVKDPSSDRALIVSNRHTIQELMSK